MTSTALERPGRRRGLIASIAITVALAVIVNAALAAFGLNHPDTERWPGFAPRGPVIGAVWVVLFAAMGAARFLIGRSRSDARAVSVLIGLCLAYPFYTHFIGGHLIELLGNIVTFAYAGWLTLRVRNGSALAAACIGAVVLWVAFATALVIALISLNGPSA